MDEISGNTNLILENLQESSNSVITKCVVDLLTKIILPKISDVHMIIQSGEELPLEEIPKIQNVFTLCCSQITKCINDLLEILKLENEQQILLKESRQCTLDRLNLCVHKLSTIEEQLKNAKSDKDSCFDQTTDSIFATPMYFVNWIDQCFEVLSKLSNMVKSDHTYFGEQWKNDVEVCLKELHISIDELLLSAMTICKYCLADDQRAVKARSQVVLRETKALFAEIIKGDIETAINFAQDNIKLPIKPTNIDVLIDVLKDALYVLERNTNTALLAILVYCFSTWKSPIDSLKDHFKNVTACSCLVKNNDEVTEGCSFVKEFDLYNERLMQIGSFAVSCSSDQTRILSLRSGLASLEALDPHLVPALLLSPESYHSRLLAESWKKEVREIRDSVFLIVDPPAFTEKCKQMMHESILSITREKRDDIKVCSTINIGCLLYQFFAVYNALEPDALTEREKLLPLLANLDKVQAECKVVYNCQTSSQDFRYTDTKISNKPATFDQLMKRLKLLYTIVNRINKLIQPKDDDEFFGLDDDEPEASVKPTTYIMSIKNGTYVNSPNPKKPHNVSRSIFARTFKISFKPPLSKLTKHLNKTNLNELSFSLKIDEMFNISEPGIRVDDSIRNFDYKQASVLYTTKKNRTSLRKAVFHRHCKMNLEKEFTKQDEDSFMDEATSLQITEILDQMNDITNTYAHPKPHTSRVIIRNRNTTITKPHVVKLNINNGNTTISKHIWNIPVNASTVEIPLDESEMSFNTNASQQSSVTTLERINDIDLIENRLNTLKFMQSKETCL